MRLLSIIIIAAFAMQSIPGWAQPSTADYQALIEQSSAADLATDLQNDRKVYVAVVSAAQEGSDKALSALGHAFEAAMDSTLKRDVAIALLQNGTVTDEIVEYVTEPVLRIVEVDVPFPYRFDTQGEIVKGSFSQELLSWCASQNLEPVQGAQRAIDDPFAVALLGSARHPSVAPTLIKVLGLKNYLSVSNAALALAFMQHKKAVPTIIGACQRSPVSVAKTIAWSLAMFDDPEAQQAAEQFIKDNKMLEAWRKYGKDLREAGYTRN